ncbi:MAG: DNA-binding PadR family transcriptional regulator [Desulforhopalus sp.]|jgi:DNA-binding PadR family transcriptional regulator
MMALNYAILKMFTKIEEGSVDTVIETLKDQYGSFKAFNKKEIINALMTAEANGLLEESRFELDSGDDLRVYYRAHEEGAATINKYIKG